VWWGDLQELLTKGEVIRHPVQEGALTSTGLANNQGDCLTSEVFTPEVITGVTDEMFILL
jgi:hypothetical protein